MVWTANERVCPQQLIVVSLHRSIGGVTIMAVICLFAFVMNPLKGGRLAFANTSDRRGLFIFFWYQWLGQLQLDWIDGYLWLTPNTMA